ncbi:hypothetical protein QL285_026298 [Trifolium repens]|nr:hypothetical protein QL285_026298 [Trifolium repens]
MVKGFAVRSKPQRGRKKLGASVPKTKRVVEPRRVEAKSAPASLDSSSSYSTDEDYAEFLKTHDPQELRLGRDNLFLVVRHYNLMVAPRGATNSL